MKKHFFLVWLLTFISIPLLSFTTPNHSQKHQQQTNYFVGYFDIGADVYEVYGDNYGGVSGSIIALYKNGAPVVLSGPNSWGSNYGPLHTALGVNAHWVGGSYVGVVYQ